MKKKTYRSFISCCAAAAAIALVGISSASAATLALWTFETSVPATAGPFAAESGNNAASSFASGFHSNAATVYSNPSGNGSAESYSSNTWSQNDYYQFTTSTLGFSGIALVFDQTRSGTGPDDFKVQGDFGSGFVDIGAPYNVAAVTWGAAALPSSYGPFILPAAADNKALITLRLVNLDTGIQAAGTNRIDNVTIVDGIPEPTSAVLAAGCALGVVAVRRRTR